jgi:hypothetical protein
MKSTRFSAPYLAPMAILVITGAAATSGSIGCTQDTEEPFTKTASALEHGDESTYGEDEEDEGDRNAESGNLLMGGPGKKKEANGVFAVIYNFFNPGGGGGGGGKKKNGGDADPGDPSHDPNAKDKCAQINNDCKKTGDSCESPISGRTGKCERAPMPGFPFACACR